MSKWLTIKEAVELSLQKRSTIVSAIEFQHIKKNSEPKRKNGIEINLLSFKQWLSGRKRIDGSCDSLYGNSDLNIGYFTADNIKEFSGDPGSCRYGKADIIQLKDELNFEELYVDKVGSRKKRRELVSFVSSCGIPGTLWVDSVDHIGDSDFLQCFEEFIGLAGWKIDKMA